MPQQNIPVKQVVVTKVIKQKSRTSLTEFLFSIIAVLSIIIIVGGVISVGIWLQTYRAFTQKKEVATLYIGQKIIREGRPSATIRYVPKDDINGLYALFNSLEKTKNEEKEVEIIGDQVFLEADFVRWADWGTLIGMKPLYKVNRLKSGFQKAEDYQRFNVTVVDINGGPDWFANKLQEDQKRFSWIGQSVFISAAGINVQNEDHSYKVFITEDAMVFEKIQ